MPVRRTSDPSKIQNGFSRPVFSRAVDIFQNVYEYFTLTPQQLLVATCQVPFLCFTHPQTSPLWVFHTPGKGSSHP